MPLAERVEPAGEIRFGVEIEGIVVGWFTECGALSIEREAILLPEGGLNAYAHQLPGRIKSADITLKRGIADRALWQWFQKGQYDLKMERHNVTIVLYGVDYAEMERWDLTDAFPIQWTGPELKTDSSQVAVETLKISQGSGVSAAVQRAAEGGESGGQTLSVEHIEQDQPVDQALDMPLLANKVYDLLRQELRLERERLGQNRSR